MQNKIIDRGDQDANKIFDERNLQNDYRTLVPLLKKGMHVLDIGCGTGAISKDIARLIGEHGKVTGIDHTAAFIKSGKENYAGIENLILIHEDLFEFITAEKFDLIVSARTLQWLSNPKQAIAKMKSLLQPDGIISILDYDHTNIQWEPMPPESMRLFYNTFLKWRADAGMNNQIAEDLPWMLKESGFEQIEKIGSNEFYDRSHPSFKSKLAIWSKVAASKQMVEEGYLEDALRLRAIEEYNDWIDTDAVSMTMKLNEVRGINTIA